MDSAPYDPNIGPPPPYYIDVLQQDNFEQYHDRQTQLHCSPLPMTISQPNQTRPEMYQAYDSQMSGSFCMLMICLILCNCSSLIFTVPAVLLSWSAVKAAENGDIRAADKRKKAAFWCVMSAVIEFVVIITILIVTITIFTLTELDRHNLIDIGLNN